MVTPFFNLLGPLDDPGHDGLNALVRHKDDALSRNDSPQPRNDTPVQTLHALARDDLDKFIHIRVADVGEMERAGDERYLW